MTAVTVTFGDTWITDVTDPTMSVRARAPINTSTAQLAGSVRFYAGGRARSIVTRNDVHTIPLTLLWVSDTDFARLKAWRGRVLLLRDSAGRRVFGTYFDIAREAIPTSDGSWQTVTLTFTELTYSEVV